MKLRSIFFYFIISLFNVQAWGQTWSLTPTMTAILDSNGVLTISTTKGEEAMPNYFNFSNTPPWGLSNNAIRSVVIENKVTSIGHFAFYGCENLSSIALPNSFKIIGTYTFVRCTALSSITIPNSVTAIGEGAFGGCTALIDVSVDWETPLSVPLHDPNLGDYGNLIGDIFFYVNTSDITLHVPAGTKERYKADPVWGKLGTIVEVVNKWNLTSTMTATLESNGLLTISTTKNAEAMPNYADEPGKGTVPPWYDVRKDIRSVKIENNVTHIGNYTFPNCSNLTSLSIPNSVVSIGDYAFSNCFTNPTTNSGLIIPDSVESIGVGAFYNCYFFSITLSNSLTSIKDYAFYGCGTLQSLKIPNSVKSIGNYAFYNSFSISSVSIPNSVKSIGDYAFAREKNPYSSYSGSITSITIPNSVESIGVGAFGFYDDDFRNIYVSWATPLSVPYIFGRISHTTLHVPTGTKDLYYAADFWKNFDSINDGTQPWNLTHTMTSNLYNGVLTISTTKDAEAMPNYFLADVQQRITYFGPPWRTSENSSNGLISSIVIENNVTSIGNYSFYNCTGITSVTIPNSVTSIGISAFAYCSALKDVTVNWATPLSVSAGIFSIQSDYYPYRNTNISTATLHVPAGTKALYAADPVWGKFGTIVEVAKTWNLTPTMTATLDSNGLLTISTTKDAEAMPDYTPIPSAATPPPYPWGISNPPPWGNDYVSSAVIEKGVTTIGAYSFYFDGYHIPLKLSSVSIPNSVILIGASAFENTDISTVILPNSLESIVQNAFAGCKKLTSITIPNSVKSIGSYVFSGCTFMSVTIPNSVTSIGYGAFRHCSNLSKIIVDSDNKNYSSLDNVLYNKDKTLLHTYPADKSDTEFSIPNSVNNIENSAFYACNNLANVVIPNSVSSIGDNAFYYSLQDITVNWAIPLSISTYIFPISNTSKSTLHVPAGTKALYEADPVWGTFGTIVESARIWNLTPTMTATLDSNGVLTISTTKDAEAMPNYADMTDVMGTIPPWYNNMRSKIRSVEIKNNVTSIGDYAFRDCTSIISVTIPNSVKSIGVFAFNNCDFTSVAIPNSVTSIGDYAFVGCSSLTSMTIPNSVTSIGREAFHDCTSLTLVTIPNSVTSIGPGVFSSCRKLSTIIVDSDNQNYSSLDNVIYNKGQTLLHTYPAGKIDTEFSIPNSVTNIEFISFYSCTNLASVTIPNSVTSIGYGAFLYCFSLQDVTVNWATPLSVPASIFSNTNISAATLHVPAGTKALYEADPVWGKFRTIQEGITVIPVTSVELNNTTAELTVGETLQLTATITPENATNKSVVWSSSNQDIAKVDSTGKVSALAAGSASIVVITVDGNKTAFCNINVKSISIEVPDSSTVSQNGNGTIILNLNIPSDVTLTGSFDIQFPEGMTLDEQLTVLSVELQGNFHLSFTYKGNNTWLIEIKSNSFKSSSSLYYREIMCIAYKVDENVEKGYYEAKIKNLDFLLDNDISIQSDLITIPVYVESSETFIENIGKSSYYAYNIDNMLIIDSSYNELITIYSISGTPLYITMKNSGLLKIPVSFLQGSVFIIQGSISGTIKVKL